MSKSRFPQSPPAQLNAVINAIETAVNSLEDGALVNARILPPLTIGTGDTRVYHGLKRPLTGLWIVMAYVDVRVAASQNPDPVDPNNFVILRASTAATVTLAVF